MASLFTRNTFFAAVVALGGVGTTANGQSASRPAPPAGGPAVDSPFWGERATVEVEQPVPTRAAEDRTYDVPTPAAPFVPNFPNDLVREVPQARANFVAIEWTRRALNNDLENTYRRLRREFEESAEVSQVTSELRQAHVELDQARREALMPLEDNEEYAAQQAVVEQIDRQIRELHDAGITKGGRVEGLANLRLEVRSDMAEAERERLQSSSRVTELRQRIGELGQRKNELEQQYERDLRQNEQIASLRQQIDSLRVAELAQAAYLNSLIRARNAAVDFAIFQQQNRRYIPSAGYGDYYNDDYGYGYGYGLGYGGIVVGRQGKFVRH